MDDSENKEKYVFLIQIVYKNGHSVRYWFDSFFIERDGYGDVRSVKYDIYSTRTRPIFLNIGDISSVHQLDIRLKSEFKNEDYVDTRMHYEK